jgi:hypothetical protein
MNTSTSAMGSSFVEVGTVYVPQPVVDLFVQLFTSWAQSSIAPVPGTVTGDENEIDIAEPLTSSALHERVPIRSPLTEPARNAAPAPTPEDQGVEASDAGGGTVAPAPGTHPAGDARPSLPAPHARVGRAWSRRRGGRLGPSPAGPLSARSADAADVSVMKDNPPTTAACCATCGTPGIRTEGWVCGVCDKPIVINGEPVLSLDGLDADLAAGGIYCETCGERRQPFERLACGGCSRPARRIGDVVEHNRREREHRQHDHAGQDSGERAAVDSPAEFPDDGITVDEEIEALLPRESSEEYALLEQDLRARGCVAPLVVWQDGPRQVLLDGHTRRAICRARHIFYEKKILDFPDRTSAIIWVIGNQLGRRNLTPEAQAYLRGRIYNLEKRQGARTDLNTSRQGGEKLSERLAEIYRVGSRTIERDGQFAMQLDQLAGMYGTAIKNAVLTRDAKMTRAEVGRAARLDAAARDRILARVRQGEVAVDVIREALHERAANDPRAHAADHLDRHTVDGVVDTLEAMIHELKQGELSPLHAQRLVQRLSEILQDLMARSATDSSATPSNEEPGAVLPSVAEPAPGAAPDASTSGRRITASAPARGHGRLPAADHLREVPIEQAYATVPGAGEGARSSVPARLPGALAGAAEAAPRR